MTAIAQISNLICLNEILWSGLLYCEERKRNALPAQRTSQKNDDMALMSEMWQGISCAT